MSNLWKHLGSAFAGAFATFLAVGPTLGPIRPARELLAQQGKPSTTRTSGGPAASASNVKVFADEAEPIYANFARVTATPEEVIIDYGLNPQPFAAEEQSVKVTRRMVLNFFTAKRFYTAMKQTIERHESTFGPIELDARKRTVAGGDR